MKIILLRTILGTWHILQTYPKEVILFFFAYALFSNMILFGEITENEAKRKIYRKRILNLLFFIRGGINNTLGGLLISVKRK